MALDYMSAVLIRDHEIVGASYLTDTRHSTTETMTTELTTKRTIQEILPLKFAVVANPEYSANLERYGVRIANEGNSIWPSIRNSRRGAFHTWR